MDFLEKAVKQQQDNNERIANSLLVAINLLSKQTGDESLKTIALLTEEFIHVSNFSDRITKIAHQRVAKTIGSEKLTKIRAFYPPFIIGNLITPYSIYLEIEKMNTENLNEFKSENETDIINKMQEILPLNNIKLMTELFSKICSYNKQLFSESFLTWLNAANKYQQD